MPDEKNIAKQRIVPRWAYNKNYGRYRLGESRVIARNIATPVLPTGTVTFLFTDIVGSVSLWEQHPQAMKESVARHHAILRQSVEDNQGVIFKIIGDAIQAAFGQATQGLAAALTAQRLLLTEDWGEAGPIWVRVGLHTGTAEISGDDYAISHTLNRTARVMSAGHGGQILLSQETADLVRRELPTDVSLVDLGEHRLKGLTQLEHLYQVNALDLPTVFPPLTTEVKSDISQLIQTKLNLPSLRPGLTPRPRLLSQMDLALQSKLVLISAPAGFGKTTLLLEWIENNHLPVAWFSLDQGDNDPARFWRYLISAFQLIKPGIGKTGFSVLQSTQIPPLEIVASELINDIAKWDECILVLDDYHWIQSKAIHDSINFFLDHLPSQAHLMITTREDPPLQLPLRRARREVKEIRTSDLRFSNEETHQFFKKSVDLKLSNEDVIALYKKTEGWIVGLQMASLSLQDIDPAGRHEFITTFTGDDRYIVDYLVEEVLQRQSTDIQNFLLRTSILDKMCGPLCDALTGNENGQAILHQLENSNLFIIPMDNRRGWYRYHSLFNILLQQRLSQTCGKDEIGQLHRQASEWYEQAGMSEEAVNHAMSVHEYSYAAQLIERHIIELYFNSEIMLVYSWLNTFPENVLNQYPLLAAVFATASTLVSSISPESMEVADRRLDNAELALEREKDAITNQTGRNLAASFIATSRAYLARFRHENPALVIELTEKALGLLPEDTLVFRSALLYNLGSAYILQDKPDQALSTLKRCQQIGLASGDYFNGIGAVFTQERLLTQLGRLYEAVALCQKAHHAIENITRNTGRLLPIAGVVYISMGNIFLEWNELDEAERQLNKGQELIALTTFLSANILMASLSARLLNIRGNPASAIDRLVQAESIFPYPIPTLQAWKVRIWLGQVSKNPYDKGKAYGWAETSGIDFNTDRAYSIEKLTLVRVWISRRREGQLNIKFIHRFLEDQLEYARQYEYSGWELEVLILQALAFQADNQTPLAISTLEKALVLAEPEGYMRAFLDEGIWMAELLKQVEDQTAVPDYVTRLLESFESELKASLATHAILPAGKLAAFHQLQPTTPPLIEPLTQRELEVLQLIADGASNPEIASALYITTNTVKKHISSLFSKMDAVSRTQAVRRGQQLGLIH